MKTRDSKNKMHKKAERQREIAGKFPFHRVADLYKISHRLRDWRDSRVARSYKKSVTI